jgi:glycerate 2-kinase
MKNILEQQDLRKDGKRKEILEAVNQAFFKNDPALKVRSYIENRSDILKSKRIKVIGFGKAAYEMYLGAQQALGNRIVYGGIIIPDDLVVDNNIINAEVFHGTHPFLSEKSIDSTEKLISKLSPLSREDTVLVLISGGGSSLFELLNEGITLEKYREITKCMMDNGADIQELNAVRYLFSKVKGGKLKNFLYPARIISLIISDVPGDDIRFIASGPLSDPPDDSLIFKTIKKFGKKCSLDFNYKYINNLKNFDAENNIIIRNEDFVFEISEYLKTRGHSVLNLGSGISGSVTNVSRMIHRISEDYFRLIDRPYFFVGGGETSVKVRGKGIGGRNLEMCLRFILNIKKGEIFIFSSIGTDGIDGPSNAMGGIVDNYTLNVLSKRKIRDFLSNSESLTPLKISKDVIITGRTGNNVSDIFVGYVEKI